jgi:hypothetical protein
MDTDKHPYVTLAEIEALTTDSEILDLFAADPLDPNWPLFLAWVNFARNVRSKAAV